ncbi:hypothetical protein J7643_13210 [bacterium]|nr:hypothetical protein [bacterium]
MWPRFLPTPWSRPSRLNDGGLDRLRTELAAQSSAAQVALVIAVHLSRLSGASGVAVRVHEGPEHKAIHVHHGEVRTPARQKHPLVAAGKSFGEITFHGPGLLRRDRWSRALAYGAVAIQNALLAEQALDAELESAQARAQRDLQYRLTWMASTQICRLLDEAQGRLRTARSQVEVAPSPALAEELSAIASSLMQLEAFVHANLNSVRGSEAP